MSKKILVRGKKQAPILVVAEDPKYVNYRDNNPLSGEALQLFVSCAHKHNLSGKDFIFVSPCGMIPKEFKNSQSKKSKLLKEYAEEFVGLVQSINPKVIIVLGNLAAQQVMGRSVKITKLRGHYDETKVFGKKVFFMLSPTQCCLYPEMIPTFESDFDLFVRMYQSDWDAGIGESDSQYTWCENLKPYLNQIPEYLSVDTETTSLLWYGSDVRVLTIQFALEPGFSLVCPVDDSFWDWSGREMERLRLIRQCRMILEDKKYKKIGHNLKYDIHMLREALGINVTNWYLDTMVMSFFVDDTLRSYSLDDCVKRWVPEMAGYADQFNATYDKDRMIDVPKDAFLQYAGGDPDAVLRLWEALRERVREDKRHYRCMRKIAMPAMRTFASVVEFYGVKVDRKELRRLKKEFLENIEEEHEKIIRSVPRKLLRQWREEKEEIKLSRPKILQDILFSKNGLNLKPRLYTKTTMDLPKEERVPSTSTKKHLPYFTDIPLVAQFVDYKKQVSVYNSFIKTFEKYLDGKGQIHSSYGVTFTRTGRTASRSPNGQNSPKRGKYAKMYRKIFVARPGYKLVETDLSQIELRLVAIAAQEKTMLDIYKHGGDIHRRTAMAAVNYTEAQFDALPKEERSLYRFRAKAINFGFIYGMSAKGFQIYAKTDYGIDYSLEEAQHFRQVFFSLYPNLLVWHNTVRHVLERKGYVRALHGTIHRYPSVWSNDDAIKAQAIRQAINAPIQRCASDIGLVGMNRLARDADQKLVRPIGFIHDAIVSEVREDYLESGASAIKWYMESVPLYKWFDIEFPIPILADVKVSKEYDLAEMEDYPVQAVKPSWFRGD